MLFLFYAMVGGYSLGALAPLLGSSKKLETWLVSSGASIGAAAGTTLGLNILVAGHAFALSVPQLLPLGGGLALRLDSLSAFFLAVIGLVTIPAAVYFAGYTAGEPSRLSGSMLNIFVFAMSLLTFADNVLTFLLLWEAMSVASYFLVIGDGRTEATVQTGLWYLGTAHLSLAFLLFVFMLLTQGGGSGAFARIRETAPALSPVVRNLAFGLACLGFGLKAGIVPLHVWLPRAHPAAPSYVSALMSGVMIKMGIYGLLRVLLDLLGGGPPWWGAILLGFGTVSALLGVLYALMERDLKRLLAYCSVENIGIILVALGAGLLFHSYGLAAMAVLSIVAALYHTVNHACFKGLLFLGAGSVLHATGTKDMEELGGLIGRMPSTALFFLVGSAAIAALPPLNGFVSEWMVFQSLLAGFQLPSPGLAALMPIAVGMLALTGGLAAACFVKAFGITFLAIPRSERAATAHESPFSMRFGMAFLAVACALLGIAPFAVVPVLALTVAGLHGLPDKGPQFTFGLSLSSVAVFGQVSPILIAGILAGILALTVLVLRLPAVNRRLRVADSWGCGRIEQTPRMEYTATAFAEPLRRVFEELYRPTKELTIDFHPESEYFVQSIEYRVEVVPWFEKVIYDPILRATRLLSLNVRRLQSGSLHLYLLYLAIALFVLLVTERWF